MHTEFMDCVHIFLSKFKFCLFILKACQTIWYTAENSDASIKCIFLKTRQVGIWSMKMLLIPCINIAYMRICLKIFPVTDSVVHYLKYILAWESENL